MSENEKDGGDVIDISRAEIRATEKARSHQRLMGGQDDGDGTASGFGTGESDNEKVYV